MPPAGIFSRPALDGQRDRAYILRQLCSAGTQHKDRTARSDALCPRRPGAFVFSLPGGYKSRGVGQRPTLPMPLTLHLPTSPWRGLRGQDAAGNGAFGASRTRNGAERTHLGLDILVQPGDAILSPIDGVVTRVGKAYADGDLGSISVAGGTVEVKILYASGAKFRKQVKAGESIGIAQDVAAYYAAKGVTSMKPHIHMEVRLLVDPALYLPPEAA